MKSQLLTATRCPKPTDSPMARGAEPVTSDRCLSVVAKTQRTSWKVAKSSMANPWPTFTPLLSYKKNKRIKKILDYIVKMRKRDSTRLYYYSHITTARQHNKCNFKIIFYLDEFWTTGPLLSEQKDPALLSNSVVTLHGICCQNGDLN